MTKRDLVAAAGATVAVMGIVGIALIKSHFREAAAREVEVQRLAAVHGEAPDRIARARAAVEDESFIDSVDQAPLDRAFAELAPLRELNPAPAGLAQVDAELAMLQQRLHRRGAVRSLDAAYNAAEVNRWQDVQLALAAARVHVQSSADPNLVARLATLEERAAPFVQATAAITVARRALDTEHPDALAAEVAYDGALAQLRALSADVRTTLRAELTPLERQLTSKRARNHRAAARIQAERERAAARLLQCGTAPGISAWDGELFGAESFVERGAHDPSSIDVENCTVPQLSTSRNQCWLSTCDVRGTNAFGAMVLNRMQFEVQHGEIVAARRR